MSHIRRWSCLFVVERVRNQQTEMGCIFLIDADNFIVASICVNVYIISDITLAYPIFRSRKIQFPIREQLSNEKSKIILGYSAWFIHTIFFSIISNGKTWLNINWDGKGGGLLDQTYTSSMQTSASLWIQILILIVFLSTIKIVKHDCVAITNANCSLKNFQPSQTPKQYQRINSKFVSEMAKNEEWIWTLFGS